MNRDRKWGVFPLCEPRNSGPPRTNNYAVELARYQHKSKSPDDSSAPRGRVGLPAEVLFTKEGVRWNSLCRPPISAFCSQEFADFGTDIRVAHEGFADKDCLGPGGGYSRDIGVGVDAAFGD
jgi:hypothetical protein